MNEAVDVRKCNAGLDEELFENLTIEEGESEMVRLAKALQTPAQSLVREDSMLLPYDDIINISDLQLKGGTQFSDSLAELGDFVLFTPPAGSSSMESPAPSTPPQQEEASDDEDIEQELREVDDNAVTIRKRSRIAKPDEWRQNLRKKLRNEGKEYLSTTGKVVPARSVQHPGVDCKCWLKCTTKISHETRQEVFQSFWNMGSLQRQRDYIGSMVQSCNILRKRVLEGSNRTATFHYHLAYNGIRHRVCKEFFENTLDISSRMVKTAMQKFARAPSTMQSSEKRGTQV